MKMFSRRGGALSIGSVAVITYLPWLAVFPPAASAQRPDKIPRVVYLNAASAASARFGLDAFRQGLREFGYIEGRNIQIEYGWADGHFDRLPALAADLIRPGVDLIVTPNTPAALAAKSVTRIIPIILVTSGDPVGSGLVASLARPGGNVTGLSLTPNLAIIGKQLELLHEVFPTLQSVAVFANPGNLPTAGLVQASELAARSLGLQLRALYVREAKEFDEAFATMMRERIAAFVVAPDPLVNDNRGRIVAFAAANRLPAVYPYRTFIDAGGLLSYGTDLADLHRRAAQFVDRILKGAKPGDLPIEQPTKFELVVNLKTATALGIAVPRSVLQRADVVLQ